MYSVEIIKEQYIECRYEIFNGSKTTNMKF